MNQSHSYFSHYIFLEYRGFEEKDLGVVVDSNLQFDNHILGKVKTANRILGLIKRCFKNLDIQSFLLLYKALVRSHLDYTQTV